MGRIPSISIALSLALALAAQEIPIRVDVRLVRLLVNVKDQNGGLVGSLDRDAFTIRDSGAPQTISVFERTTSQPLSISLLIDTSGSTAKDLKFEIAAAARFLKAITKEGNSDDALALYSFNHDTALVANFTRNPSRITRALQSLTAEAGTSLYDALVLSSERVQDRDGRHVLIVISDGGDTTSRYDYHAALKALHRADAILYPIVIQPITNDAGRNIGGENALIQLAASTGGKTFFASDGPALDDAFSTILRDLRTQYLIAYYPRNLAVSPRGTFRKVEVLLNDPKLRASTRGGYYEE